MYTYLYELRNKQLTLYLKFLKMNLISKTIEEKINCYIVTVQILSFLRFYKMMIIYRYASQYFNPLI